MCVFIFSLSAIPPSCYAYRSCWHAPCPSPSRHLKTLNPLELARMNPLKWIGAYGLGMAIGFAACLLARLT